MKTENIMNVPLDDKTKENLKKVAEENGRAVCREAAAIIKREVNK